MFGILQTSTIFNKIVSGLSVKHGETSEQGIEETELGAQKSLTTTDRSSSDENIPLCDLISQCEQHSEEISSSDDDKPLINIQQKLQNKRKRKVLPTSSSFDIDDDDNDKTYLPSDETSSDSQEETPCREKRKA